MRIQFVITRGDTIGGAQNHVIEMSSALSRLGHDVQVVIGDGAKVPDELQQRGVACRQIPELRRSLLFLPFDLGNLLRIRRAVRDFRPNLVSTHSSKTGVLGRIAARSLGIPCIYTAHGWSGVREGGFFKLPFRLLELFLSFFCDRIITVSAADAGYARGMGIAARKVLTVHNGRPDVEGHLRAQHEQRRPVRIVMIGRMQEPKDHALLFRALAHLDDSPSWRLQIVGDGDDQAVLEERARELGIEERVDFLGLRDDVPEILAEADLFCLVSRSEGFPRSTLEAMRAGLPVVVSDVGGSREAVVEGETGFVVPRGDEEALRDRLLRLLKDRDLRGHMGAAGRRRFEEQFTFPRMFEKTVAVYKEVLEEHDVPWREPGQA